jgi:hypothetical protein
VARATRRYGTEMIRPTRYDNVRWTMDAHGVPAAGSEGLGSEMESELERGLDSLDCR